MNKLSWFLPEFGELEKIEVLKVLESGYINDGELVRQFENDFSKLIGVKYSVAVTSGTAALTLALIGLGINKDDEVIVPDFTFIATANAVKLSGASVKLVDIEPKRFNIDPEKVIEAIGPKTKAIIAVDVNGRGADYSTLSEICKAENLFLICDSAEALGSKYNNQYLGSYGDAACFSFSANKTVTSGQGGMITTNNENLYYRLRELKDQGRRFGGTGGDDLHPVLGFNFKYTNLQAAVAIAQMKRLNSRIQHAKNRDQLYLKYLKNAQNVTLPASENQIAEVCQWTDLLSNKRKHIEEIFKNNNIGCRPFWFPLHRQTPYKQEDKAFKNAIHVSETGMWLPSAFNIEEKDIKSVSDLILQSTMNDQTSKVTLV